MDFQVCRPQNYRIFCHLNNSVVFQLYTVKNEEFLELLELAIYSFVIVTNTPGSSNELQSVLLDRVWVHRSEIHTK